MIAGQHHRSQASLAQPRDRLLDAGRRRIGESDEPDEGQPVKCVLPRPAHLAAGDREHPQSRAGKPIVHGDEGGAVLVIDGHLAVGSHQFRAQLEDAARRALRRDDHAAARRVEGRHQLPLARERDHAQGSTLAHRRTANALERVQHSAIDGIDQGARDVPAISLELAIVVGRRLLPARLCGRTEERQQVISRSCGAIGPQVHFAPGGPDAHDRHLPRRQCPGLVRANHGGRAERLDRGEPAYERVPPGHAAHADGQRNRRHGWKRFGNSRDRQRNAGLDDKTPWRTLYRAQRGDHGGDRQGEPDQTMAKRIEPPLERRALFRHRSDERADAAHLGGGTRCHYHRASGPHRHGRALVKHVDAIRQRRIDGKDGIGVLRDRKRFTSERGLREAQVGRRQEARVCRHPMARARLDHIARHERVRIDHSELPVTNHWRARDVELEQRLHRTPGSPFGRETDDRVDHEHDADRAGLQPIAECQRHECRRQKQDNHDTGQLIAKDAERRRRRGWSETVGSVLLEARPRVLLGQTGARRSRHRKRRIDRQRVPRGARHCLIRNARRHYRGFGISTQNHPRISPSLNPTARSRG